MTNEPLVSIIIRTKNEERWITHCLESVTSQSHTNIEIIVVDNNSTDDTLRRAKQFPIKIVTISEFVPGKALNDGIRNSSGEIIVCLSAHCVPIGNEWLSNLIAPLTNNSVAGVYGKQEPTNFSSDVDKRDLITVFGLDTIVQRKDPFFHNANSALLRATWDQFPFDENVANLEDRVWGQKVIDAGLTIVYEPLAVVTHWHGIHHGASLSRARGVMKVIDSLGTRRPDSSSIDPKQLNIVAVIPVRSSSINDSSQHLLQIAIDSCLQSEFVCQTIVSTDDVRTMNLAISMGADAPFIRPEYLSEPEVNVLDVIKYSLNQLESSGAIIDVIVVLEMTYPFRPKSLIDDLIGRLVSQGLDTVLAGKPEKRSIWSVDQGEFNAVVNPLTPRDLKLKSGIIGLMGLGLVSRPDSIRNGTVLDSDVGIVEILDEFASIEVRNDTQATKSKSLINFLRSINAEQI